MMVNNCIKQFFEFDQNYTPLYNLIIATNLQILVKTEYEDKFNIKDLILAEYSHTFDYIIFSLN